MNELGWWPLALMITLVGVAGGSLALSWRRRRRADLQLASLESALGAIRDGDYSIRLSEGQAGAELRPLFREVNALGEQLRGQRLGGMEASVLLETIVAQIDVAILAFDDQGKIRLSNPTGAALVRHAEADLTGRTATELGVADWLEGPVPRTVQLAGAGGQPSRWELRRQIFRQEGKRHTLVVLSDLGRALREEERQVWQRLIRVLGHELNNSLAPIRSIATSLQELLADDPLPTDWKREVSDGLGVVAGRAAALGRFVGSYARLAQLPPPRPQPIDVSAWAARVAQLETRVPVLCQPGPAVRLYADPDQMDQLLINLTRNAADATLEDPGTGSPSVTIRWTVVSDRLELRVEDPGPGLSAQANLFVPFFTTKPGGSGIGLVLCRQIAEAHSGTLTLANRPDARGCVATLTLPLTPP